MAENQNTPDTVILDTVTTAATQPNLTELQAQLEKAKQELALEKMTERIIYEEGEKKTQAAETSQLAELENSINQAA
jgi:hypothetical protein